MSDPLSESVAVYADAARQLQADRLREALEVNDEMADNGFAPSDPVIVAAAGRWLALTETGQEKRMCEVHDSFWLTEDREGLEHCIGGSWLVDEGRWDCRTVPVLVIPADYLTEEET